jgi:chemotaxis signal transduction protein
VKALVCFTSAHGPMAAPVEAVRAVLEHEELTPLPSARPGVAGILRPETDALPVLDVLAPPGEHVLVLEAGGLRFGLCVTAVTDVIRVDDSAARPAPAGQDEPLVRGLVRTGDGNVQLVDLDGLAARLR